MAYSLFVYLTTILFETPGMHLYESFTHVWFLCRFYSLHFFKNHNNELRITRKSFFISIIPAITFVIAIFLAYVFSKIRASDVDMYGDPTTILFIVTVLGLVSLHLNGFVLIIASLVHRNEVLTLYNKLNELDNELKKTLHIKFNYKKLKENTLNRLILIGLPYFLFTCVTNYVYIIDLSDIPFSIIFNFINGTELISSFHYNFWTKIITYRFNTLNNLLKTSHMIPSQLEAMIKNHISINALITDVNKIYGFRKLYSIANDFFVLLAQLYAFFLSIDDKESIFSYTNSKYLLGLTSIPIVIIKIVVTTKSCEKAIKAQKTFGKLLKTFQNNQKVSDLVNFLYFFSKINFTF